MDEAGRTDRQRGFPGIARRRLGHRHGAFCRSRLVGLLSARRSTKMRFATDTGGTFTDLIIEDDAGHIRMFKAATVPAEPVKGVLDAFEVAAREFQVDRRALLGRGDMFVHGTTHAINAIVTKTTARTALLVTSGHPDILLQARAGDASLSITRSPTPILTFPARSLSRCRSAYWHPAKSARLWTKTRSRPLPTDFPGLASRLSRFVCYGRSCIRR